MGRQGVAVFSRSLRYRNKTVTLPNRSEFTFLVGEGKGACAFPLSPTSRNRRGINETDWIPISRAMYDAVSTIAITGRPDQIPPSPLARPTSPTKCQKLEGATSLVPVTPWSFGAADRIRTGDVQLGKLAFCH
jgi:hypothetical protein